MADKLTAEECYLIAHYGFQGRVDDVVNKTINYQWARRQLTAAEEDLRIASEALQATTRLADKLPARLNLKATAEHELRLAEHNLAQARNKLPVQAEAFFDVAGPAAPLLIELMENADWQLTRPKLSEALEDAFAH